ncbi:unnamed protein product [Symbiodinium pilosum]|uniref:Uncharacterized protein n=1 Tax=Symbiodinium pilosum TaxID=2952 RepID=A0A812QND5_SYMPI|nr:unnamed protein product [Symbiodinium pilosum]
MRVLHTEASIRADVEATRQLFKAAPGASEKDLCSPSVVRSRSAGKLSPLPLDERAPHYRTASLGCSNRLTSDLASFPQVAELGSGGFEAASSKVKVVPESNGPASASSAVLVFDSEDEALIAWSQTVGLDDVDVEGDLTLPAD